VNYYFFPSLVSPTGTPRRFVKFLAINGLFLVRNRGMATNDPDVRRVITPPYHRLQPLFQRTKLQSSIIQMVGDDTVTASPIFNRTTLAFRISSSVQERITMEIILFNSGC
jgi:hypothetical protein